ncbi:extracellular solute-binding protein [Dongia sedimenti]|uniref:Extracellular solute-binding protein n=1 Tax=Dongia sedimenti TaxID=3064282 RepID=A0ABU0YWI7_9PROT|nr:extracellular solute-binding protein [Rhodospirillaceae bacterium R-7]
MTVVGRRHFLATAAGAAALLAHVPARAQQAIKLRVTAAPSTQADMYRLMGQAFEAKHPGISIAIDATQRDYNALVDATLRDSLTGELADVSIQGNSTLRLYADRGMAVALDSELEAEMASPQTTLSPSVASIGRVGGKVHGLGLLVSTPVIFFNLDLVKKTGGDPAKLPTDWDGILELARKINDPATSTLGAYFTYDQADWFWIALMESQGVGVMNADETDVGFAGAEGLKAMQLLKSFGVAGQSKVDMPRDQVRQLFASGKLGILADSSSSLGIFEKQSAGRFQLATVRFPLLSPNAHLPAGGALGVVFAKEPERRKAAWEFLKFAAGAEGQTIIARNSGYMVANSRVATDPNGLAPLFAERPNIKPVVETLPLLDGWYAFPGENGRKITKVLIDHMRSVILQQIEPDVALAAMTTDVRALLAR